MSLADQIRRSVEPRVINRDQLLRLADEVARLELRCAALTETRDELLAAANPGPIIARLHGFTLSYGNAVLMDDSTIEIEGVEWPIPARHSKGGIFAPLRISEAITAAGYRPVGGNYYAALDVDGPGTIAVERV
jgi:hypothetical protein